MLNLSINSLYNAGFDGYVGSDLETLAINYSPLARLVKCHLQGNVNE